MEEFQADHVRALSAHLEGLEAALEALPSDRSAEASLRRLARSLASGAKGLGATALAEAGLAVQNAEAGTVEQVTRSLLKRADAARARTGRGAIRVLLVEDNQTVAAAVQAYLKAPDHEVHHATDAATAERLLHEQPIDVVLLDLILPDRDGRDLLLQMREDRRTEGIPIIVLSAKEGIVARSECLAVGAREFLQKPVDPRTLRAAVARHGRARGVPHRPDELGPGRMLDRVGLLETFEELRVSGAAPRLGSVALLAVDGLEGLDEQVGPDLVDGLVTVVGEHLGAVIGGDEAVGRWKRGELVLLLAANSRVEAQRTLEAGLARLAASEDWRPHQSLDAPPSFSAGVASADSDEDLRELVSAAERSVYRARAGGQAVLVSPEEGEPGRPHRVMLVEDDRVTATLIHHRLVREDFEVMDFVDGEDAYEWAVDSSFDLAILDVKVPGMDGFELLERLRAIPRLDSVPIVMLTGLGGEADVIRGLELGANDYMLKPFSPTELLARIRRLVFGGTSGTPDAGSARRVPAEVVAP